MEGDAMSPDDFVHKELCDERSTQIREDIKEIKSWSKAIVLLIVAELLAVGFALITGCFPQ